MKKKLLLTKLGGLLLLMTSGFMNSQTIIYQQDFDGNNGTFANALLSQATATNGWLASSTAAQYGNYRHVWNFSNVANPLNAHCNPITGRSLGIGFWNGNEPNLANQYFRTWDGTTDINAYTTRWAHIGVSTVGYENITVEFKWRCTGEVTAGTIYDYGTVNTSINGGTNWTMDLTGGQAGKTDEQGTFAGGLYYGNSGVQTSVITLDASRNNQANFRLAFRMVVNGLLGTGGGFIIDDIIIRGVPSVLATTNADLAKIDAYKDGENFVVKASSEIKNVELYDASGRLASTLNGGSKEVRFASNQLATGMYILKATLKNGTQLTKKIKK